MASKGWESFDKFDFHFDWESRNIQGFAKKVRTFLMQCFRSTSHVFSLFSASSEAPVIHPLLSLLLLLYQFYTRVFIRTPSTSLSVDLAIHVGNENEDSLNCRTAEQLTHHEHHCPLGLILRPGHYWIYLRDSAQWLKIAKNVLLEF